MDWLAPHHVVLDYYTKTITLETSTMSLVVWQRSISHNATGIISYIQTKQLRSTSCLDYLAYVCDMIAEAPTIELVPMVCEFSDVGLPLEKDVNFSIKLESCTKPIFVPPY